MAAIRARLPRRPYRSRFGTGTGLRRCTAVPKRSRGSSFIIRTPNSARSDGLRLLRPWRSSWRGRRTVDARAHRADRCDALPASPHRPPAAAAPSGNLSPPSSTPVCQSGPYPHVTPGSSSRTQKRRAGRYPSRIWRRGGVATQRPAKPSTPVRLRSSPLGPSARHAPRATTQPRATTVKKSRLYGSRNLPAIPI